MCCYIILIVLLHHSVVTSCVVTSFWSCCYIILVDLHNSGWFTSFWSCCYIILVVPAHCYIISLSQRLLTRSLGMSNSQSAYSFCSYWSRGAMHCDCSNCKMRVVWQSLAELQKGCAITVVDLCFIPWHMFSTQTRPFCYNSIALGAARYRSLVASQAQFQQNRWWG